MRRRPRRNHSRALSDAEVSTIHRQRLARSRELERQAPAGMVWHVSFDRSCSLSDYTFADGTQIRMQPQASTDVFRTDVTRQLFADGGQAMTTRRRAIGTNPVQALASGHQIEAANISGLRHALAALTSQVETSYPLTGPNGCTQDVVGDALHWTARILVNEDRWARDRVCGWYREQGLSPACGSGEPSRTNRDLPQPWTVSSVRSTSGRSIPLFLCRPAPSGAELERALRLLEAR